MRKTKKQVLLNELIANALLVWKKESYAVEENNGEYFLIHQDKGDKLKITRAEKIDKDTLLVEYRNTRNSKNGYEYFTIVKTAQQENVCEKVEMRDFFSNYPITQQEPYKTFLTNLGKKGSFIREEGIVSYIAKPKYTLFNKEKIFIEITADGIEFYELYKISGEKKNIHRIKGNSFGNIEKRTEIFDGEINRFSKKIERMSHTQRLAIAEAINATYFKDTFLENKINFDSLDCIPMRADEVLKRADSISTYCSLFFGSIPKDLDIFSLHSAFSFSYFYRKISDEDKEKFLDFFKKFGKSIESNCGDMLFYKQICYYHSKFKSKSVFSFMEVGVGRKFFETIFSSHKDVCNVPFYIDDFKKKTLSIAECKKYIERLS